MGWQQWFIWESKEKREARRKVYFNKIYPMGTQQQDWEKKTMKEIFPKEKHPEDLIFELIVLKEVIINGQLDPEDANYKPESYGLSKWESSRLTRMLKDEEKAIIKAMAYLEVAATSMEELPTVEAIIEKSAEYRKKTDTEK